MFGSSTLDVAIGVVFVYLALSLVCTAANELLASLWKWRAKNLAEGLRNLLNCENQDQLMTLFYKHPLIETLYRDAKRLPSYLPSRTFAFALMDIVAPVGTADRSTINGIRTAVTATNKVNQQVKDSLLVLIDHADNAMKEAVTATQRAETALSKVQENVETWFNDSMERVGGWYKRKTQVLTFVLALIFTIALNVDSILITKRLSSDPTLRAAVVATAEKSAQQPAAIVVTQPANPARAAADQESVEARTGAAYKALLDKQDALQSLGVPLGWGDRKNWPGSDGRSGMPLFWDWLSKVFGLLLTAGAASLGAPFWFDMLNKIVTIRSAGKAPEEKQKSPKEVPTPTEAGQTPKEARESKDAFSEVHGKLDQLIQAIEARDKPPGGA